MFRFHRQKEAATRRRPKVEGDEHCREIHRTLPSLLPGLCAGRLVSSSGAPCAFPETPDPCAWWRCVGVEIREGEGKINVQWKMAITVLV